MGRDRVRGAAQVGSGRISASRSAGRRRARRRGRDLLALHLDRAGTRAAIFFTRGVGRMVIWGDEWIKYDSEWMTPDVPALWVNIFNYIGPTSICMVPGGSRLRS